MSSPTCNQFRSKQLAITKRILGNGLDFRLLRDPMALCALSALTSVSTLQPRKLHSAYGGAGPRRERTNDVEWVSTSFGRRDNCQTRASHSLLKRS